MSPEPTQEASKEELDLESLNENVRIPVAPESEDEDPHNAGYILLPDNSNDNDLVINNDETDEDDEDGEWAASSTSQQNYLNDQDISQSDIPLEVINIWSSTVNQSNIDLDTEKISQVKSLMASFTLPNSVIPEWASKISEEQWKQQLMERISEIQKKNSS